MSKNLYEKHSFNSKQRNQYISELCFGNFSDMQKLNKDINNLQMQKQQLLLKKEVLIKNQQRKTTKKQKDRENITQFIEKKNNQLRQKKDKFEVLTRRKNFMMNTIIQLKKIIKQNDKLKQKSLSLAQKSFNNLKKLPQIQRGQKNNKTNISSQSILNNRFQNQDFISKKTQKNSQQLVIINTVKIRKQSSIQKGMSRKMKKTFLLYFNIDKLTSKKIFKLPKKNILIIELIQKTCQILESTTKFKQLTSIELNKQFNNFYQDSVKYFNQNETVVSEKESFTQKTNKSFLRGLTPNQSVIQFSCMNVLQTINRLKSKNEDFLIETIAKNSQNGIQSFDQNAFESQNTIKVQQSNQSIQYQQNHKERLIQINIGIKNNQNQFFRQNLLKNTVIKKINFYLQDQCIVGIKLRLIDQNAPETDEINFFGQKSYEKKALYFTQQNKIDSLYYIYQENFGIVYLKIYLLDGQCCSILTPKDHDFKKINTFQIPKNHLIKCMKFQFLNKRLNFLSFLLSQRLFSTNQIILQFLKIIY